MTPGFERVCVIGLGYVGLPTAAILANRGFHVVGVDVNAETVSMVNEGRAHFSEPDLDVMVRGAVAAGRLRAAATADRADVFLVTVPTPFTADRRPDLSFLRSAAHSIAPVLDDSNLIVIESTSPVGTTQAFSEWLAEVRPDLSLPHRDGEDAQVRLAHSPERVLPGRILVELVQNDRVIGGLSARCARRAAAFYETFVNGKCLITDARTAELVKLVENSYRDVNISFANEISVVCDRLGIDAWEVLRLANRHPRVDILKPGPGVGGHCIAVDPWFIIDSAPDESVLIRAARRVNDAMPKHVVAKVREAAKRFEAPCIACLGLSYKADIEDARESPALVIVETLARDGVGDILVVEPHAGGLPAPLDAVPGVTKVDLDAALEAAHVVVLLVDHRAFAGIDRSRLDGKAVIDTRGLWR